MGNRSDDDRKSLPEKARALGETLMKLAGQQGMNPDTLARVAGISKARLGLYISGDAFPDTEELDRLAKALDVTPDQLRGLPQRPRHSRPRPGLRCAALQLSHCLF